MKAIFKQNEVEYLKWSDNLHDMKVFCGDNCVITYETCCVDDYYCLHLDDDFKNKTVVVPAGHYVIKFDGYITAMDPQIFTLLFSPT